MLLPLEHWATACSFLIISLITLLIYVSRCHSRYWTSRGIHSVPSIPIIGSIWDILTRRLSLLEFFQNCYNMTDKKIIGFFLFYKPALLIRCPDMIRQIYVKDFNSFPDRYLGHNANDAIATNNLFFIKSPEWNELKKYLTPTFTSLKLKTMFTHVREVGDELDSYLSEIIAENQNEGVVCDTRDLALRFALDIISTIVFGVKSNCLRDTEGEITKLGRSILEPTTHRIIKIGALFFIPELIRFCNIKFMKPEEETVLRKLSWDIINHREASGVKRNDFIDILIKLKNMPHNGEGLKFEGDTLVSQMFIFFVAGYETSAVTLSFALYEVALNQEIQNKLRREILEMIENNNGEITYDLITNMTYLDMVTSEVLRKHSSLAFLDRACKDKNGYTLPEPYSHVKLSYNTPIYLCPAAVHMDPEIYPDPEVFDPERFTKKARQARHPCAYMPFGVGPRTCVGERLGLLEVKVGLISLLKRYKVSPCSQTPIPLVLDPLGFTKTSKGGLHLKIEKLNK